MVSMGVLYCLMLTVILGWAARWFRKGAMVLSAVCAAAIMPHTFSLPPICSSLAGCRCCPWRSCVFYTATGLPARHCSLRLFLSAFIPCLIRFVSVRVCFGCVHLPRVGFWQLWAERTARGAFWRTAVSRPTVGALAAFGASVVYKSCVLARLDGGRQLHGRGLAEPAAVRLFESLGPMSIHKRLCRQGR